MTYDYLYNKKGVIIATIVILVLGTVSYFGTGAYKQSSMVPQIDKDVLTLLQYSELKAVYNENGHVLVFALARSNDINKLDAIQGKPLPEAGELVIGNIEGSMMKDKKLFSNIGDNLVDFGLTFTVVGILSKTNTFADDFHFINSREYDLLQADENVLLIKFKDPKTPKLFYLYSQNNPSSVNISLSEGNMINYNQQIMDAKVYYPIILGFEEAKMMREEKLFTNTGDVIYDFFGRDVIIIGIMEKTGTSMDMMHIVQPDFFEEQTTVVLA